MRTSWSKRGRPLWLLLVIAMLLTGCGDGEDSSGMPDWVDSVYPEPGATAAVPDGVEVNHSVQGPHQDVRLVIDGTDVTTYAAFEAGKIRYESGLGPVVLGGGPHTAEVQLVEVEEFGEQFQIIDSYTWEFRTA